MGHGGRGGETQNKGCGGVSQREGGREPEHECLVGKWGEIRQMRESDFGAEQIDARARRARPRACVSLSSLSLSPSLRI